MYFISPRPVRFIFSMITALIMVGCGGDAIPEEDFQSRASSKSIRTYADLAPEPQRVAFEEEQAPDQPPPGNPARPRMIIRTAGLSCEVASFDEALDGIRSITTRFNGYIVTSSRSGGDTDYVYGEVVMRIPSAQFDAALAAIKETVQTVESERIDGNDVSEQFYDLVARLDNKKKAEKRYQEILRSARTVKDILEVEKALTEVRGEIERMEGRRRYLADQVAMSTISLDLHEPRPITSSGNRSFWAKITRSFSRGLDGFGSAVGGSIEFIIAGSPIVVIFGGLGWLGLKGLRRLRRKSKD